MRETNRPTSELLALSDLSAEDPSMVNNKATGGKTQHSLQVSAGRSCVCLEVISL